MIDWYNLLMNACWIFGCALALATISYSSWESSIYKQRFLITIGRSRTQLALNIAGVFFCTGLAGTSDVNWQRLLWIILAIGFLIQTVIGIYQIRRNGENPKTN